ncbi:MAG: isoaspartyl peptidase/L-asparaginase family protein [Candidatus Binatia bacterium]
MPGPTLIVHGGAGRHAADAEAAARAGCERAADAGWRVMVGGGTAVDAVVASVIALEDDPVFNAGIGSCLNADGEVEMDASIMDGARVAGAGVGVVTTVRNPVALARAVLEDGRHVLIAGAGAEALARHRQLATLERERFITPQQRARWLANRPQGGGTVGAVALDPAGHVAAATSTGGLLGKLPGRIGDSAIIGAGTYADDAAGAASATGHGETIILAGLARKAVDGVRSGRDPRAVAEHLLGELQRAQAPSCGLILLDRFGRVGVATTAEHMPAAMRSARASRCA